MERKVKELLKDAIYKWVAKTFGTQEADDPSWSIDALADALSKGSLKLDIFRIVERKYLTDDCKQTAQDNNITLTNREVSLVVDEFIDSEAYVDPHTADWLYFIKQVTGKNSQ